MRVIYVDAGIGERIGERNDANDANYDKLVSELVSDYSNWSILCDPSIQHHRLFEHLRCEY